MDFALSPKATETSEKMWDFMRSHVFPASALIGFAATKAVTQSTGASANVANAIAVTTSNLLIAGPPAASDCSSTSCTNGSISR